MLELPEDRLKLVFDFATKGGEKGSWVYFRYLLITYKLEPWMYVKLIDYFLNNLWKDNLINRIFNNIKLPEEALDKVFLHITQQSIWEIQDVTDSLILKYKAYIDWECYLNTYIVKRHQTVSLIALDSILATKDANLIETALKHVVITKDLVVKYDALFRRNIELLLCNPSVSEDIISIYWPPKKDYYYYPLNYCFSNNFLQTHEINIDFYIDMFSSLNADYIRTALETGLCSWSKLPIILQKTKLGEDFIVKYWDKIEEQNKNLDISSMYCTQGFSEAFLIEHKEQWSHDMSLISKMLSQYNFSPAFLEKYIFRNSQIINKGNYFTILLKMFSTQVVPEELLIKYDDVVCSYNYVSDILLHQKVSVDYVAKHKDKVDGNILAKSQPSINTSLASKEVLSVLAPSLQWSNSLVSKLEPLYQANILDLVELIKPAYRKYLNWHYIFLNTTFTDTQLVKYIRYLKRVGQRVLVLNTLLLKHGLTLKLAERLLRACKSCPDIALCVLKVVMCQLKCDEAFISNMLDKGVLQALASPIIDEMLLYRAYTPQFIERHLDYLKGSKKVLSKYQPLNLDMIVKYKDCFDHASLMENEHLTSIEKLKIKLLVYEDGGDA